MDVFLTTSNGTHGIFMHKTNRRKSFDIIASPEYDRHIKMSNIECLINMININ